MSVLSVLKTIGKLPLEVLNFLGSSKGQAVVAAGEGIAEAVGLPAAVVNVFNATLAQIIQVEAIGASAADGAATNEAKLTAVVAAVTPQYLSFATAQGLPAPTATKIQNITNYLVSALNELEGK